MSAFGKLRHSAAGQTHRKRSTFRLFFPKINHQDHKGVFTKNTMNAATSAVSFVHFVVFTFVSFVFKTHYVGIK